MKNQREEIDALIAELKKDRLRVLSDMTISREAIEAAARGPDGKFERTSSIGAFDASVEPMRMSLTMRRRPLTPLSLTSHRYHPCRGNGCRAGAGCGYGRTPW